jgi:SAM-dependent methyltransferase
VLGIDCGPDFIRIAEEERAARGIDHLRYEAADIESCELESEAFDLAFSRFGLMFCRSPLRMFRNIASALRPGGLVYGIVWQGIDVNPCWGDAEDIALRHLPMPGGDAPNCGPGPFSMANPETVRRMLDAAQLEGAEFTSLEAEVMVGETIDEAVDYQSMVGPAGFIIRENGAEGEAKMSAIRDDLAAYYGTVARDDGSVWLGSKSWLVTARKPS